ncbi:hypothetical protein [Paenibacillus cremeus]|nr:hypothetical protein [Paenibacillus cremeus]
MPQEPDRQPANDPEHRKPNEQSVVGLTFSQTEEEYADQDEYIDEP